MARLTRYFAPGTVQHLIQRGNNRGAIFFADADYEVYREYLATEAAREGCAIHGYVLMPNHVHLLLTPARADSIPRTLQGLGRRYVRYVNATYDRTGTLWEGRYRATLLDAGSWLLDVLHYIETNPVRHGLVKAPEAWQWSSHRGHVADWVDPMLSKHPYFMALGFNTKLRAAEWRARCVDPLPQDRTDAIRAATNGGWVLGDEAFQKRMQAETGRRAAPLPRGRPRKNPVGPAVPEDEADQRA